VHIIAQGQGVDDETGTLTYTSQWDNLLVPCLGGSGSAPACRFRGRHRPWSPLAQVSAWLSPHKGSPDSALWLDVDIQCPGKRTRRAVSAADKGPCPRRCPPTATGNMLIAEPVPFAGLWANQV